MIINLKNISICVETALKNTNTYKHAIIYYYERLYAHTNIFLNCRENSEKLVQGVYIWGSDEFKRLFLPALAFDRVCCDLYNEPRSGGTIRADPDPLWLPPANLFSLLAYNIII